MSYFVFVCLLLICKRDTTDFGEVFMKNDTTDSKECDQKRWRLLNINKRHS